MSYETTEKDLEREFGRYGPIERIRIVKAEDGDSSKPSNKKKKHRGYAFILYEREKDMKGTFVPLLTRLTSAAAYKETDGIRIKDRRVLVDVERGRTVKDWRPRRLGGGLGGRGYTRPTQVRPVAFSGPSDPARVGGFRGSAGGRDGFRGGGDRGPPGGRGGVGYQSGGGYGGRGPGGPNGYGAPPNAPAGPGRGNYGEPRRYDGGRSSGGGVTGSNAEPIRPRVGGSGYGDRDRDRDRDRGGYGRSRDDDHDRKRSYEGQNYEDPRKLRRY